jgi:hypothetical protein
MTKRDRDERAGNGLVPLDRLTAEQVIELALKAIALRRTGHSWGQIAGQLGRPMLEVEALAKRGYEHFLGQQDADTIRAEVEDRLDAVLRQANIDLAGAETVAERNALYRTILATEAQRSRLLGLNLKGTGGEGDE